jgi:hypothetical protein
MGDQRRNLKLKNTDPPGGAPAKRPILLVEAEVIEDQRRNLKLKNTNPPGGPPAKRRRLIDERLDCYQVLVPSRPVSDCDLCVDG